MPFRKIAHFLSFLSLVSLIGLAGCGHHPDPWKEANAGQKRILAVTPALYCFAKNVGGDKAAVLCLLAEKGPHDYQPTAQDAAKARKADLFLANGLELDDFVAKVAAVSGNKSLVIFKVGEKLDSKKLIVPGHDHGAAEEDAHDHDHGIYDPHIWLSPGLAGDMSELIFQKMKTLDPANEADYKKNLDIFKAQLHALGEEGKALFAKKANKKVLPMHDSMRYFGNYFGLKVQDPIHEKPGFEAEIPRIQLRAKQCKENNIKVICVEPQYSKGPAELLQKNLKAEGVDIKIVEFDPLETIAPGESLDSEYYFRRMRQNLKNLAEALE